MPAFKSFVDVLFILLLGTMVMLTQSVQVGAVDTVVARLGAGGVSPVNADEVRVIVVGEDDLRLDGRAGSLQELARSIRAPQPVLLVTANREVRHHRVMAVWSALRQRGHNVMLGAEPVPDAPDR